MSDLVCAILRDEPVVWPETASGAAELFEAAQKQGVHLLIAYGLRQRGASSPWCKSGVAPRTAMRPPGKARRPRIPGVFEGGATQSGGMQRRPNAAGVAPRAAKERCPRQLRARFEAALRDEAAIEQIGRRELREVIAELHAKDVEPLVLKGAALAFTHYSDPALRPRIDVDLLVNPAEVQTTTAVLDRLGYHRPPFVTGTLVTYQVPYCKTDRYGVEHVLDIHWRTSNPQRFANLLPMEELVARAVPVPPLGEAARALGPVHALALACIHRAAHHHNEDRLIWLYDIHLLAGRLSSAEAEDFLHLAVAKEIRAVCARGLSLAQQRFETTLPPGLLEGLKIPSAEERDEASADYLGRDMRKVDILLSDLTALDSWRKRLRLLREHVFPPAAYMQEIYGVPNRALLPVLYAWRFVGGARGWFHRGKVTNS